MSVDQLALKLGVDQHRGLTSVEARKRLKNNRVYGEKSQLRQVLILLLRQISSPLVYVLIMAAIVALIIGHRQDALLIAIMLIAETIVGFLQEYKADQALKYLKKITPRQAKIIRNGKMIEVPVNNLVRGDLILLGEGDKVPADIRIIHSDNLLANESQLTGESKPVRKKADIEHLAGDNLRIQPNIAYWGTTILSGYGRGIILDVGANVRFAKILEVAEEEQDSLSPLEKEVRKLASSMLILASILLAIIFILTIVRHSAWQDSVSLIVNLFVAIIPEGLPVIATVILATAATRMIKHKALTRRLSAAEALGNIDLLLCDKTGTLTSGEMQVRHLWVDDKLIDIGNAGSTAIKVNEDYKELVRAGCYASSGRIEHGLRGIRKHGDPIDTALISLSYYWKGERKDNHQDHKIDTMAFESRKRFMAVLFRKGLRNELYVKGAPEELLKRADYIMAGGQRKKLVQAELDHYNCAYHKLAQGGQRVIAVARKVMPRSVKKIQEDDIKDLEIIGLVGIEDAPHNNVRSTIESLVESGVEVKMVTGDLPATAFSIAREVGIAKTDSRVVSGDKLTRYFATQPEKNNLKSSHYLAGVVVFARMMPEQKFELVKYYQALGYRVAVTGDGVNDAAALKIADIGVALAGNNSDIARETADVVLLDNNIATLVLALREGRTVWANFRKVIFFLLSTDLAEVLIILGALILSYKVPFSPVQILWINLVIDTLACQALAFEPSEEGLQERHGRGLLPAWLVSRIFITAVWQSLIVLFVYWWGINYFGQTQASTIALLTLAAMQIVNIFNARSLTKSIFDIKRSRNYWLYYSVLITIVLMLLALYYVPLRSFLGISLLPLNVVGTIILVSLSIIGVIELDKMWYIGRKNKNKEKYG